MFGFFTKKSSNNKRSNAGNKNKTTKTGMKASNMKNKKLKTKKEMTKLKTKLPADYLLIAKGTFAEMSQITPEVYLTGIFGLTKENFEENRITHVVNVSYEAPDIEINGISYIRILVDDDPTEDLYPFFDTGADFINKAVKEGGHCVVHCVAGVSRSTTVVLAYLIKHKHMTLKQGFKLVYEKRKCIKPIIGFMKQLMAFEKKTLGNNSFQMVSHKKDSVSVTVPDFWITDYPSMVDLEIDQQKQKLAQQSGHRTVSPTSTVEAGKSSVAPNNSNHSKD